MKNNWKRHIKLGLLVAALAYAGLLVMVYFTQSSYLYFPPEASKRKFDFHLNRPGAQLGGWVDSGNPQEAAVIFGGNAMAWWIRLRTETRSEFMYSC
jgi:cytochrome c-type biogenesis protein CcmE